MVKSLPVMAALTVSCSRLRRPTSNAPFSDMAIHHARHLRLLLSSDPSTTNAPLPTIRLLCNCQSDSFRPRPPTSNAPRHCHFKDFWVFANLFLFAPAASAYLERALTTYNILWHSPFLLFPSAPVYLKCTRSPVIAIARTCHLLFVPSLNAAAYYEQKFTRHDNCLCSPAFLFLHRPCLSTRTAPLLQSRHFPTLASSFLCSSSTPAYLRAHSCLLQPLYVYTHRLFAVLVRLPRTHAYQSRQYSLLAGFSSFAAPAYLDRALSTSEIDGHSPVQFFHRPHPPTPNVCPRRL